MLFLFLIQVLAANALSHGPVSGYYLAKTPILNKGTSFTLEERKNLQVAGLYGAGDPIPLDVKVANLMTQLRLKTSPIEKYTYLHTIQDGDETLYYAALCQHTAEIMPFVYTPTVGEACQKWSHITRSTPRGVYLSIKDKGNIRAILEQQPNKNIKAIVFTDGERILGLGDLGANGMGIPIGKLALYTACAGIPPAACLPVHIDVGTNTESIRNDPMYMGLKQPRDRSPAYDALIEEFFDACQAVYGKNVLMQFEDFGNSNAFGLLDKFRKRACVFNDDIQGTASVALAGILSSLKLAKKSKLSDHTFLFFGAGEAGVGIADLLASAIANQDKTSLAEARKSIWLVDSKGLISSARTDKLAHHKQPYAHDLKVVPTDDSLLASIQAVKPSAIIGVSTQGGAFNEAVFKEMSANNEVPVVFALSNPTSKAECTSKQAYEWTNGKCVFASGSPMDPVTLADGRHFIPGQGNNAYIFPGVGLGAIASGATSITDDDFYIAAAALAALVPEDRLAVGCAYPSLDNIREVSLKIAAAVAEAVFDSGRASLPKPANVMEACRKLMYYPSY